MKIREAPHRIDGFPLRGKPILRHWLAKDGKARRQIQMQLIGTDIAQALADGSLTSAKAVLNGSGAIFFPSHEQHRDQRGPGISYEDDDQGSALAAILDNCQIQIRYHAAYSEARVASVLTALVQHPNLQFLREWRLTYQGREVRRAP